MKVYLKSITPVFIGSGKGYEPFDYVIYNDEIYFIDIDKIFTVILDKYNDASEKLLKWIESFSKKISQERDNRIQSQLRSSFNILNFIENELKDVEIKNNIQKNLSSFSKYKIGRSYLGNKKVILQALKNSNYDLYIPGSSIKGALRTALLYKTINSLSEKNNQISKKILKELEYVNSLQGDHKRREKNKLKANIGDILEKEVFYCGIKKRQRDREFISYDDEKFDLMKIVHISDTDSVSISENGTISVIDLFTYRADEAQQQTPAIEAIKQGAILSFDISIDMDFLLKAKELLKENTSFGKNEWIGFKDKFERLFGIKLNDLSKENLKEKEVKIINNIFTATNEFYKEVKLQEMRTAVSKAKRKVIKTPELRKFYEKNIDNQIIKIGFGTGFLGITIMLSMIRNEILKETYTKLLKFLNIGKPQNAPEDWEFNIDLFPVSRRYDNQPDMLLPLGWLKFSFKKDEIEQFSVENFSVPIANNYSESSFGQVIYQQPKSTKPQGTIKAEIIDDINKPTKIKVLEGEYNNRETVLQSINLQGLGLKKGDKIYVKINADKNKKIINAEYKGIVAEDNSS